MVAFGAAVQKYRDRGWQAFPLPSNQKHPPPANLTGQNGRLPTNEDYEQWASLDANIGVRAHGVLGIDVDQYMKDGQQKTGVQDLADLQSRFGPLPRTWRSGSREQGGILWYKVDPALTFVRGVGSVDIIQRSHRYGVVEGLHPEGREYRWRDQNDMECGPPHVDALPALPESWVRGLESRGELRGSAGFSRAESEMWLKQLRPGEMCPTVGSNLEAAKADLSRPGISHHDSAVSSTFALISQGSAGHAGVFTALTALGEHFASAVGRQDAQAEYERMVVGAVDKLATEHPSPGTSCSCDLPATDGLPDLDDESLARWLLELNLPARLKYIVGTGDGLWGTFQGTHWTVSRDSSWAETEIRRSMFEQLQSERDALEEDAKQLLWLDKLRAKVGESSKVTGVVRAVRATGDYRASMEAFDRDPNLLNLRNGTYDLSSMQLRDHVAEDLLLSVAPVSFQADATAPYFHSALSVVLPDPQVKAYLQRLLGQALLGEGSEQVMSLWLGRGGNMKSALLTILQGVMGSYLWTTADDFLQKKLSRGHETSVAMLEGARLLFTSETGKGETLDASLVKSLTGDAMTNARRMYQDARTFKNTWSTLFCLTNNVPLVDAFDDGLFRRLQILPWDVVVPRENQDLNLARRIIDTESSGVLNWLLDGLRSWREQGLNPPARVVEFTKSYRLTAEPTAAYMTDYIVDDPQAWTSTSQVAQHYETWAASQAEVSEVRKLQSILAGRYAQAKRAGKRGFQGMSLRAL